jgi:hypothetical protein
MMSVSGWQSNYQQSRESKMPRPGLVVTLRINPRDAMSIIDVLKRLEISSVNISFAQATKIALSSALESFRQTGLIPDRTGFEYSDMIAPFLKPSLVDRGSMLKTTELLASPDFGAPPLVEEPPERASRHRRYDELVIKKNADPLNFSEEEQEELRPLLDEFYN